MLLGTHKEEFEWGDDELDMVKYSVINNQTRSDDDECSASAV
jgi:hypothetical protein